MQRQHLQRQLAVHPNLQLRPLMTSLQLHLPALTPQQAASLVELMWLASMRIQLARLLQGCQRGRSMCNRPPSHGVLPRKLAAGSASRCEQQRIRQWQI